jgi:carbamoyl-phosphate synthase large subunit
MKNILISSSGRRVELVNLFKTAIKEYQIDSKLLGLDASKSAPTSKFVDEFILSPKIDDIKFKKFLYETVKNKSIGLIIPTVDTELEFYSMIKDDLKNKFNCLVLISDYQIISIFRNKLLSHDFFISHGFKSPKLYSRFDQITFPVFVKPKDGSSSIGAFKVDNSLELDYQIKKNPQVMIQEYIQGIEYSVDVFNYINNKNVSIVARERIQVRSGEISKGRLVKDELITSTIQKLISTFKFIGNITIQIIKRNNEIYFIEINPRFGGGTPISIMAGARSCHYVLDIMMEKPLLSYPDIKEEGYFSRFDQTVFL